MRTGANLPPYLRGVAVRIAVFALVVTAVAVWSPLRGGEKGPGDRGGEDVATLSVAGQPETVFDWSREACDEQHIPDLPVRALRGPDGTVRLLLSSPGSRWMVGRDLERLRVDCNVAMRSTLDARPEAFDDREWLASLWSEDGRSVVGLVHDEYHGHRHRGRCPAASYLPCWYNAITLADSTDGGRSFSQPSPAALNLVAASTQPFRPGAGPHGAFSPSNVVPGPDDGHLYAVYSVREPDGRRGTCVMRTRAPHDPGSWLSWGGEAFDVPPHSPYDGPPPTACAVVARNEISEMRESLTYQPSLGIYLLLGMASKPDPEQGGRLVSGVYYSLSRDLVEWAPRRLLLEATTTQLHRCGDPAPIAYPSLIDPDSGSPVYATVGDDPYLYFTRFNYSGCEMTWDRDLMRVPIRVSG